jgi:hypothetical protein
MKSMMHDDRVPSATPYTYAKIEQIQIWHMLMYFGKKRWHEWQEPSSHQDKIDTNRSALM